MIEIGGRPTLWHIWQQMVTLRDERHLEELRAGGKAPRKIW